jgi:hypothetical protein
MRMDVENCDSYIRILSWTVYNARGVLGLQNIPVTGSGEGKDYVA